MQTISSISYLNDHFVGDDEGRAGEVEPVRPMSSNACMIPHTVPKRPMNGQTLEVVAKKISLLSKCEISEVIVRSKMRSMLILATSTRNSGCTS
ncbi:hypothetical protein D3C83_70970 [compost metagenome]